LPVESDHVAFECIFSKCQGLTMSTKRDVLLFIPYFLTEDNRQGACSR